MKRYVIYLTASLLTFLIGSLFAFNHFIAKPFKVNQETKFEMTQINGEWQFVPEKEFTKQKETHIPIKSEPIEYKKPFCNDPKILPIWYLLKDDFIDESDSMFREPNCANMFEV